MQQFQEKTNKRTYSRLIGDFSPENRYSASLIHLAIMHADKGAEGN